MESELYAGRFQLWFLNPESNLKEALYHILWIKLMKLRSP